MYLPLWTSLLVAMHDDIENTSTVHIHCIILNTYRTAVSPTLDLLCHEDFNVGRSEAESNIEIFMAQ